MSLTPPPPLPPPFVSILNLSTRAVITFLERAPCQNTTFYMKGQRHTLETYLCISIFSIYSPFAITREHSKSIYLEHLSYLHAMWTILHVFEAPEFLLKRSECGVGDLGWWQQR